MIPRGDDFLNNIYRIHPNPFRHSQAERGFGQCFAFWSENTQLFLDIPSFSHISSENVRLFGDLDEIFTTFSENPNDILMILRILVIYGQL